MQQLDSQRKQTTVHTVMKVLFIPLRVWKFFMWAIFLIQILFFKFTFYLTPDLFTHPNHSRLIRAAQNSQLWQRQSSQMSLNPQMHVFGFLCSFFMKCWIKEMYLEHVCNTMQKLFLHALYMNVWLKLMILIIKDRQYHYENTNSETSWLNLIKIFLQIPIEVYFFSIICIFPLPSRSLYKQHEGREKKSLPSCSYYELCEGRSLDWFWF